MDELTFDLTPTADELAGQQAAESEPSFDETLLARYEDLLRDKRGELDLPCPTWDEGHCGCYQHAGPDGCPTWEDGCRCDVGHTSAEDCPRWASGCCCDHAPTAEVATRTCNNHFGPHSGPAHTAKEGQAWCPAHQATCADGPHPFVTWQQFRARFQPAQQDDGGPAGG